MSAWKKPSRKRMAQEALDHLAAERRQVVALGLERGAVVERRAVDPFEREHLARGAVPVDRRHAEILVLARVLRHLGERGRLQAEIHFDGDRTRQRRHRFDRAQPLRFQRQAFRLARNVEESIEIDLEAALDAGTQDFHRHGFRAPPSASTSARCTCAMEAAATAGPKFGEHVLDRLVEGCGDHGFRLALRKRRHLVLQAFQIARDLLADHVGPGGHELAELDVGGPQLGERGGEPAGAVFRRGTLEQAGERDGRFCRQRQRPRVDQREHAFAREHKTGARETGEMGKAGDHNFQPECSATTPAVMLV